MDENKFWLLLWVSFFAAVVLITGIGTYASIKTTNIFAEHGYIECSILGSSDAKWCKR